MNLSDRISKTFILSRPLAAWMLWGIVVALSVSNLGTYASSSSELSEAQRRQKLLEIRQKQIPLLEEFVKKYPRSPQTAEMLFRLSEAYFEMGKQMQVANDKARAAEFIRRARVQVEKLRADFPSYQRLDEALFLLANSYMEANDMTNAGYVLAQIAENYPRSPILKDAALLLGDHYFEKNQFAKAENYYQQALGNPKVQSYVYYKLAWASSNLGQSARALQYFEKVLELRNSDHAQGYDYTKDAAREMVLAAFDVKTKTHVIAYLEKQLNDPDLIRLALSTLASAMVQRAHYDFASVLYGHLRKTYPADAAQEEWLSAQIKAEENLGRADRIASLVAEMGIGSAAIQNQILNSARKFHAEGQKATIPADKKRFYDLAITYYEAVLKAAEPGPKTAETQFYFGEALYTRERFAEAASYYRASAQTASSIQAKAAWNWYLTAEKLADGFHHKGHELKATSPRDEEFLASARFLQDIEGVSLENKRKASYQTARLLYQLNQYDRALPVFQFLAEKHTNSTEGKLSANLVLDIFNLKKDYRAVAEYAKTYQKMGVGSPSELGSLAAIAELKVLENDEQAARALSGEAQYEALENVGRRYIAYADAHSSMEKGDAVLWAGFKLLAYVADARKAKDFPELRSTFFKYVSRYPRSKHKVEAVTIMGNLVEARKSNLKLVREFMDYRTAWLKEGASIERDKRGPRLMLIYQMSNESQKKALLADMAKLPTTEVNREANAYGRLVDIRAAERKMRAVALNNVKTLGKKTIRKLKLLEELQDKVTDLVKLKVAEPAIEALQILGEGYAHVASSIRKAPVPKTLSGDQLAQYRSAVDQKAGEIEAKGREAKRLAEETARELDISG